MIFRHLFPSNLVGLLICALLISSAAGKKTKASANKGKGSSSTTYLFDISSDPYESKDISEKSKYKSIKSEILERAEYWADKVVEPEEVDYKSYFSTFEKCGGVCSFMDGTEEKSKPFDVPRDKYSSSDAPNIVFVLVDDWGWNDVGFRSTYMSWTTPTIDRLAAEGVTLENYHTSYQCVPARTSLMTGRYAIRQGTWGTNIETELTLDESTLAQELQTAGYVTYMVGKWHLGFATTAHKPLQRGFDYYYGYLTGKVDYWTKEYNSQYLDLQEGNSLVSDKSEISSDYHNGFLLEDKAEEYIKYHSEKYGSKKPMFLYYAMQMVHSPLSAPETYLTRCGKPSSIDDDYAYDTEYNYCATNIMVDEAVANLTCTLESYGFSDNTVLIIASDNGGDKSTKGANYPLKGRKGEAWRGGVSANAIIHSSLISSKRQGKSYSGLMHVTDWFPTIMNIATSGKWDGTPISGNDLDGVDMWDAINDNDDSPRSEIVHYHDGTNSVIQIGDYKLFVGQEDTEVYKPLYTFSKDQDSDLASYQCENPSLMSDSSPLSWKKLLKAMKSLALSEVVTEIPTEADAARRSRAARILRPHITPVQVVIMMSMAMLVMGTAMAIVMKKRMGVVRQEELDPLTVKYLLSSA